MKKLDSTENIQNIQNIDCPSKKWTRLRQKYSISNVKLKKKSNHGNFKKSSPYSRFFTPEPQGNPSGSPGGT